MASSRDFGTGVRREPASRLEAVCRRFGTDWARRYDRAVADLYSLVHREAGPVSTFLTREEAEAELEAVLEDEPA